MRVDEHRVGAAASLEAVLHTVRLALNAVDDSLERVTRGGIARVGCRGRGRRLEACHLSHAMDQTHTDTQRNDAKARAQAGDVPH